MLKRLFVYDRLFSSLLVVLLTSVFLIMFYGLDLYYQFSKIDDNIQCIKYTEQYDYGIRFSPELFTANGRVPFKKGIVIYRTFFPMGDSAFNHNNIDILWEQNEPLLEQIEYNSGYDSLRGVGEHLCVLSDKWKKSIIVKENEEFIDILGTEFKVIGYFAPLLIDGSDERCLIIGDSLTPEELCRIAVFTDGQFIYKSASYSGIMEDFENWLQNYSLSENINFELAIDMVMDSNISIAKMYEGYAKKIFVALSIFCIINTFYLSFVWGKKKEKTLVIKKIYGYSNRYLVKDMLKEIALFELISIASAGLITLIYEIAFRNLSEWTSILIKGMPIVIAVISCITVVYLISQIIWIIRSQPVDVLRFSE